MVDITCQLCITYQVDITAAVTTAAVSVMSWATYLAVDIMVAEVTTVADIIECSINCLLDY